MKKLLFIFLMFSLSIAVFSQNINYVELLDSIPTGTFLEDSIFVKYLGNDNILDKFKRTNHQIFQIKNKFLNKNNNVITLIIYEHQAVGNRAFMVSFSNLGEIIDEKRIMNAFNADDMLKPRFYYSYSLNGKQVKIEYCRTNPTLDINNMITDNDSIWFSYVYINDSGYLFEFSKKEHSTEVRLFPEASERLLSKTELLHLTKDELKIMRNEIFASKGYNFKTNRYKSYFTEQKWYEPQYENVGNELTEIEKENIKLIKQVEQIAKEKEEENNKLLQGLWF
ncbi:MAG: YARHG domain-containing protein [Candidatus Cloacimonadales bacterium]